MKPKSFSSKLGLSRNQVLRTAAGSTQDTTLGRDNVSSSSCLGEGQLTNQAVTKQKPQDFYTVLRQHNLALPNVLAILA